MCRFPRENAQVHIVPPKWVRQNAKKSFRKASKQPRRRGVRVFGASDMVTAAASTTAAGIAAAKSAASSTDAASTDRRRQHRRRHHRDAASTDAASTDAASTGATSTGATSTDAMCREECCGLSIQPCRPITPCTSPVPMCILHWVAEQRSHDRCSSSGCSFVEYRLPRDLAAATAQRRLVATTHSNSLGPNRTCVRRVHLHELSMSSACAPVSITRHWLHARFTCSRADRSSRCPRRRFMEGGGATG